MILELLSGVDLDSRVARAVVRVDGARGGKAVRVLVEQNVTLVLNELALPEDTIHLSPATRAAVQADAGLGKTSTKGVSSLPPMRADVSEAEQCCKMGTTYAW